LKEKERVMADEYDAPVAVPGEYEDAPVEDDSAGAHAAPEEVVEAPEAVEVPEEVVVAEDAAHDPEQFYNAGNPLARSVIYDVTK
jgi:hypothetical protein